MKLTHILIVFAMTITFAHPAFAYLDTGISAGSFMLQMLIAGITAILFTIKV